MRNNNMGGPAFPQTISTLDGVPTFPAEYGVAGATLWDYYAAAALPECLYTIDGVTRLAVEAADRAGEIADAMLAERNKRMEDD